MIFTLSLFLGLCIGLMIGLIGSGGSLIAVPAITLLLGYEISLATTVSALIVALTSFIALGQHFYKVRLLQSNVILPSLSGALGAIVGGWFFFNLSDVWLFTFLALVMFLAAWTMNVKHSPRGVTHHKSNKVLIVVLSMIIGSFSGMLGIGGGFLMIPLMMRFAATSFQSAIVVSQVFVLTNSIIALAFRLPYWSDFEIDQISAVVVAAMVTVLAVGRWTATKSEVAMARIFRVLMVFGAILILITEVYPNV